MDLPNDLQPVPAGVPHDLQPVAPALPHDLQPVSAAPIPHDLQPVATSTAAAVQHMRERDPLGNFENAVDKGMAGAAMKVGQGAEAIFRTATGTPSAIPALLPSDRVHRASQALENAIPTYAGPTDTVGRIAGGAVPALVAGAVAGPEAIPVVMGAQGATEGAASTQDQAAAARARGMGVSPVREAVATGAGALVGGAVGYGTGAAMGAVGEVGGPVVRAAGITALGIPQTLASNAQQNMTGKIVDPNQAWQPPTGREFAQNAATNLAFHAGGELGRLGSPPSNDHAPSVPGESVQTSGASAPETQLPAASSVQNQDHPETAAPAPQPTPDRQVAAPASGAEANSVSAQSASPESTTSLPDDLRPIGAPGEMIKSAAGKPVALPPLDPDVHPSVVTDAWNAVAADRPELAAQIKRIEPLDNYKYPSANASFNPATGVLRVNVDKPMTPETLLHEFTHVAQAQRGGALSPSDFNTEEEFDRAIEAPARAAAGEASKPGNTGKLFEGKKNQGVSGGAQPMAKAVTGYEPPEARGDIYGSLSERLAATAHHLADAANRYSGKMFPTVTRLSQTSGEKMSRWISSRAYVSEAAPQIASEVVGDKPGSKDDILAGTAMVQDNLDSIRKGFIEKAQSAKDPAERQAALESASKVKDIVGAPDSPIKTHSEYKQILSDPKYRAIFDRYNKWFSGEPEQNFRTAQDIATDKDLPSRGENTGRVNLKAVAEGDKATPSTVYTSGRGNLNNPLVKKSPFARAATGTGEGYDVSLSSMIQNTMAKGTEIARQREAYDQLVKDELAKYGKPGDEIKIGGKPTVGFDIKKQTVVLPESGTAIPQNKKIFVRADMAGELRRALAVDAPTTSRTLQVITGVANKMALASSLEGAYHLRNQLSTVVKTPGLGTVLPDAIKETWNMLSGDPATKSRFVDLAKIGALREKSAPLEGWRKISPMNVGGKVIEGADRIGRLMMDTAFKRMAAKGLFKDTETNRRDFVNQLGQYNVRGQHELIALARDTGLGPFATAGSNFYSAGVKSLALSPGAEATSRAAAINLRARVLVRYASIAGAVALANYMKTGRVDGTKNIPFGSIYTGKGDDGKDRYWDALGNLTPLRRGFRATGIGSATDVARGRPAHPVRDVGGAALSPVLGPLPNAIEVGVSGNDLSGFHEADYAKKDESQDVKNLIGAARGLNPLVEGLTSKTRTLSQTLLGPFGIGEAAKQKDPETDPRLIQKNKDERATREANKKLPADVQDIRERLAKLKRLGSSRSADEEQERQILQRMEDDRNGPKQPK